LTFALPPAGPEISYLARDFAALRQRLLDRLAVVLPDWSNRQIPDVTMTLVELLAFVGDRLSYHQDAVATEAYIGTARRRVSVRRHARLVNEALHEGCCARTVVLLEELDSSPELALDALAFVTPFDDAPVGPAVLPQPPEFGGEVFCPAPGSVPPLFGQLSLAEDLGAGATSAAIEGSAALHLRPGSLLIFETKEGAHPVRLSSVRALGGGTARAAWHWDDRLPQAAPRATTRLSGAALCVEHGRPLCERLSADRRLRRGPVTFSDVPRAGDSCARLLRPDAKRAVPQIRLLEGTQRAVWQWRPDLLDSRADDPHFTLEIDDNGAAHVRFGDGSCGRAPDEHAFFDVEYRVGNGVAGNVAANALTHVVGGRLRVCQHGAARGGAAAEPVEALRARLVLRSSELPARAVVAADYARIAQAHPRVQRAAAHIAWSGTCELVRVAIDPAAAYELPDDLKAELVASLEGVRRIGQEVRVELARFVPIRIWLEVTIRREHSRAAAARAIRGKLRELLHPDQLSFGQPVYQSHLVRAVRAIGAVESIGTIDATRVTDSVGLDSSGVLRISPLEIARFEDDEQPSENGYLELSLRGGR
jgi:hypothetical protein